MPAKRKAAPTAASDRPKRVRVGDVVKQNNTGTSDKLGKTSMAKPSSHTKTKSDKNGGISKKVPTAQAVKKDIQKSKGTDNIAFVDVASTEKTTGSLARSKIKANTNTSKSKPSIASHPKSPGAKNPHDPVLAMSLKGCMRTSISPRIAKSIRVSRANIRGKEIAKDENPGDKQYWLMKAEPDDRFEKGVNVKFSIDDLAAASKPEPWDGVRNYVARNNMRAMRKGDLAFFYHSNCKVPGIVGVMRIVQEHTVDESAFDPKHPYYDEKSDRDKPRWDVVHVEFVKKFDVQITLKMMNDNAVTTGELGSMQVLKLKRLSVTSVQPAEWRYILELAGESSNLGEAATTATGKIRADEGYAADTDGEAERPARTGEVVGTGLAG